MTAWPIPWKHPPARVMPPPEPPLEVLEHQAYTSALTARERAFSGHVRGETDGWPEPYGPDVIVFGPRLNWAPVQPGVTS